MKSFLISSRKKKEGGREEKFNKTQTKKREPKLLVANTRTTQSNSFNSKNRSWDERKKIIKN